MKKHPDNLANKNFSTNPRNQQGAVILESMIAILIFSIGLLAIVALQGVSIRNITGAKHRSDASLLSNQIIGQMWTADKNALPTNFSSPGGALYNNWVTTKVIPALPGSSTNLPTITFTGSQQATITIFWQEPGESGPPHQLITIANING